MRKDRSIHLLTGDTGFHVLDDLKEEFADRYLNTGICEAAMAGVAAGLAVEGKRVFVFGIAPFVTMRCFEQVRNDICGQDLPVTLVGVGAGLTYGPAGMTHMAVDDIAVLSALPNMTVVCPGDPPETAAATRAILSHPGPCYLRLGKSGEPVVHARALETFELGRAITVRKGRDIALISTGTILPVAAEAGEMLNAEVISMPTVKPLDRAAVIDLAARCRAIATIEEHMLIGGLGSRVAALIAEETLDVRLKMFGLPDAYAARAGSQAFLRKQYGLTAPAIVEYLREFNHG
jgi:transketolase